jgi:hypothetical protein
MTGNIALHVACCTLRIAQFCFFFIIIIIVIILSFSSVSSSVFSSWLALESSVRVPVLRRSSWASRMANRRKTNHLR